MFPVSRSQPNDNVGGPAAPQPRHCRQSHPLQQGLQTEVRVLQDPPAQTREFDS